MTDIVLHAICVVVSSVISILKQRKFIFREVNSLIQWHMTSVRAVF